MSDWAREFNAIGAKGAPIKRPLSSLCLTLLEHLIYFFYSISKKVTNRSSGFNDRINIHPRGGGFGLFNRHSR